MDRKESNNNTQTFKEIAKSVSLNKKISFYKMAFSSSICLKEHQPVHNEVAVSAANAFVSSCLDYCNSLFRGLSCFHLHKLQFIQNTLACIDTSHRKCVYVTPIFK